MYSDKIRKIYNNSRVIKNPFLLFLPFLLLYTGFVLLLHNNTMWGDEVRHYNSAMNLLNGVYSPPPPNVIFDTGPGYPLFMAPFIALNLPLVWIKLMNAVFQYLSIICLFKSLKYFLSFKPALIVSLFWGCYFHIFDFMAFMVAESLIIFLASLLLLLLVKALPQNESKNTKNYVYLAGVTMGCMALTKVIFGYIIVFIMIGSVLFWVISRRSPNFKRVAFITLIGLATTLPYLVYTYQLTGKFFYWSTSGGNNLYWMSSPFPGEYGDWLPAPLSDSIETKSTGKLETGGILSIKNKTEFTPGMEDSIKSHHGKDFEYINRYKGVEQDDAFKNIAINNIKTHPGKYVMNWFSNVGRMLFNYPYSYTYQKPTTLMRIPLNGIIVVFIIFCMFPTMVNWRKIPFAMRLTLLFTLVYLGVSTLASAETRMLTVVVPMLLLWIAFVITKSITIKLKDWESL